MTGASGHDVSRQNLKPRLGRDTGASAGRLMDSSRGEGDLIKLGGERKRERKGERRREKERKSESH